MQKYWLVDSSGRQMILAPFCPASPISSTALATFSSTSVEKFIWTSAHFNFMVLLLAQGPTGATALIFGTIVRPYRSTVSSRFGMYG